MLLACEDPVLFQQLVDEYTAFAPGHSSQSDRAATGAGSSRATNSRTAGA